VLLNSLGLLCFVQQNTETRAAILSNATDQASVEELQAHIEHVCEQIPDEKAPTFKPAEIE